MKRYGEIIEEYLQRNFNITVILDADGWESILLHHEEIEEDVIPKVYLNKFMNPLLFHMTTYEDDKDNEWLFSLATPPNDLKHLIYVTCFKNNEYFTSWIPNR